MFYQLNEPVVATAVIFGTSKIEYTFTLQSDLLKLFEWWTSK